MSVRHHLLCLRVYENVNGVLRQIGGVFQPLKPGLPKTDPQTSNRHGTVDIHDKDMLSRLVISCYAVREGESAQERESFDEQIRNLEDSLRLTLSLGNYDDESHANTHSLHPIHPPPEILGHQFFETSSKLGHWTTFRYPDSPIESESILSRSFVDTLTGHSSQSSYLSVDNQLRGQIGLHAPRFYESRSSVSFSGSTWLEDNSLH